MTENIPLYGLREMMRFSGDMSARGRGLALVPTMGYLHQGHLSLIRKARQLRPVVVVSIFVNPIQFGPGEDFERYPRNMEGDHDLAAGAGADVIFAPTVEEMYPGGYQTRVEVTELQKYLCGASRPGHFQGVATAVLKLFNIIRPEVALFGEKDFQQLVVIKRMVRDLDLPVEVVGCPIVREGDGLAMSSRNEYLSAEERAAARCLYQALLAGRKAVEEGEREAGRVRKIMAGIIRGTKGTEIDYISVSDPEKLTELEHVAEENLLAVAVRIGPARLIDNMRISLHNDGKRMDRCREYS